MAPRRRSSRHTVVPDSDIESEIEQIMDTKSVFKGVIIPKKATASVSTSGPSRDASTRSVSTEYETPSTSAAVTPAESVSRGRPSRSLLRNTSIKDFKLGGSSINTTTKRKRPSRGKSLTSTTIDTSRDEEVALQLQEDEYKDESFDFKIPNLSKSFKPKAFNKMKLEVSDSDDESLLTVLDVRLLSALPP
jgi:hypothetical protein